MRILRWGQTAGLCGSFVSRFNSLGRVGVAAASLLAVLGAAETASAQNSTGFALNRFDPSERGSDWFWAESLDMRGHNRWAVGVVGDWAYKPLVAYDENGDEVSALVEHQVNAHLGASVMLWDRLRLGLSVPILLYQTGEDTTLDGVTYSAPEGAAFGDIRLGGDVRLYGEYGEAFTLALGTHVHLPTGSQEAYTSDGTARLVPRLSAAGDIGIFTYAVKTGFNFRFESDDFAGQAFGHEWTVGGAAGLRLIDKKLTIGPEIWTSTVLEDGFSEGTTPFEGVFGAHYRVHPDWQIGAAVGPGFTRGLGTPVLRTLLSVEWFPQPKEEVAPPAPVDTDGDGIFDEDDACPTEPGPANTEDPTKHGCPLPPDTDGDGIIDAEDACANEPGPADTEDPTKHGCPLPDDTDGDGILDPDDACPTEPGPANTEDPTKHGCPLMDNDGDKILNEDDACPDTPGVADEDPAKHGCPKAKIEGGQVMILERIEFDSGKASIRDASMHVLEAVKMVLTDHPEISKIRIEGHTDDRGAAWYNKKLSDDRAGAVAAWLTENGIDASRLSHEGKGEDAPIETNDTAEGRQNNRRVEFHITKTDDTQTSKETK